MLFAEKMLETYRELNEVENGTSFTKEGFEQLDREVQRALKTKWGKGCFTGVLVMGAAMGVTYGAITLAEKIKSKRDKG